MSTHKKKIHKWILCCDDGKNSLSLFGDGGVRLYEKIVQRFVVKAVIRLRPSTGFMPSWAPLIWAWKRLLSLRVSHLALACQLILQAGGNVVEKGFTSEGKKNYIFTHNRWGMEENTPHEAEGTNQFGCNITNKCFKQTGEVSLIINTSHGMIHGYYTSVHITYYCTFS